ncbi:MAG: transposase family protein [Paludibacteraceae bacterium]|nr:transposase family protein [Paludibacteraceae bacterium]
MEKFGKTKIDFLKTFLKLPNNIPSHDTIAGGDNQFFLQLLEN